MPTPVILPKQGNSVETCIIQAWKKQPGETVAEGDVVVEVETDKAVVEVGAPCAGVLLEQFFAVDAEVPVMTNIAAIGEAGEDVSGLRPQAAAPAQPAASEPAVPVAEAPGVSTPTPDPAPVETTALEVAPVSGDAGSSPRARSLAQAQAVDLAHLRGSGPGGLVIERDVQAQLDGRARVSPAALAALRGGGLVAPERGSGPDGLILVEDLLPVAVHESVSGAVDDGDAADYDDLPLSRLRKVIAQRMCASLASAAQYTLTATAKVGVLQRLRAGFKANADRLGIADISLGDMIVFAVSRVLPRFPDLNAHLLEDRLRRYSAVNLGLAVDTQRGLLVPVLPRAGRRSLEGLASMAKELARACQDGSIAPEQLEGGTFTISNLGALGIEAFTPVLNTPEVAILGVGGIVLRPFAGADGIEHHPTMTLSLTCDHRAVDGAPAARFLAALVQAIEHFDLMLAK